MRLKIPVSFVIEAISAVCKIYHSLIKLHAALETLVGTEAQTTKTGYKVNYLPQESRSAGQRATVYARDQK